VNANLYFCASTIRKPQTFGLPLATRMKTVLDRSLGPTKRETSLAVNRFRVPSKAAAHQIPKPFGMLFKKVPSGSFSQSRKDSVRLLIYGVRSSSE